MKMVFIQNFLGPHFGIMYLSALLKQHGCATDVFIEGLHKNIIENICEANPDIIGFTCVTGEHRWVEKRAAEIKKKLAVPIIVGGPHPTYFPQMIEMKNIDIICRGEAENTILELLNKTKNKENINNILGLWVKENNIIYKNEVAPIIKNLDSLPYPDREIYDKYRFFRDETELVISTSRGCPFNCSFCYNASKRELYESQQIVRLRTPENILKEIKILLKKFSKTKSITFNDDNICLNAEWFDIFFKKYAEEIGLPFIASIRVDFMTEDRIKKLKKANCFCLTTGLETGNNELRRKILKKQISNESYLNAAKLAKKYKIQLRTSNMFFLPGETVEMALDTIKLNKKMKVDFPWAYALQPYPGTEIYNYCIKNKFLDKNFSFDNIDLLGILESPTASSLKDGNKIKVLHRLFYYGVKIPGFIYLLKFLVFIPNNFIFELLHRFSILITYAQFHRVNIFRAMFISMQAKLMKKRK